MLDREYVIYGTHADKVKQLKETLPNLEEAKFFERTVDIVLVAPILGVLYRRKAERNKSEDSVTKVFSDTLRREGKKLKHIMQLILLYDKEDQSSDKEKIDKIFKAKDIFSQENVEVFNQYFRGGVDLLYEKLIDQEYNTDDYWLNLCSFISDYSEKFYE